MSFSCRDGGTADTPDSGSGASNGVGVQISFSAVISICFSNTYIGSPLAYYQGLEGFWYIYKS